MADGGAFPAMIAFTPNKENERAFRDALGRFATGVTVVTTLSDQGPLGITANSFSSVSLDPPLVLWSPARASRRFAAYEAAEHYAIHILGEEQRDLCRRFSRDGLDFAGLDWTPNAEGVPLIHNCIARFDCIRHAAYDGGDHLIIVGRVLSAEIRNGPPLLFAAGNFGRFTDTP
jgi:flavin reductase (DIM6/NTAB) family NADH-FMN oxidoreductase RutF